MCLERIDVVGSPAPDTIVCGCVVDIDAEETLINESSNPRSLTTKNVGKALSRQLPLRAMFRKEKWLQIFQ